MSDTFPDNASPLEKAQIDALIKHLAAGATTIQALRGAGYNPSMITITWAETDPDIQRQVRLTQQSLYPFLSPEERADRIYEAQLRRALDFAYECKNPTAVVNALSLLQKHLEEANKRNKPLEQKEIQVIRETPVYPKPKLVPSKSNDEDTIQ